MKVHVNKAFYDVKQCVTRKVGEIFDATQARIDEIKGVDPELVEVEQPRAKKQPAQAKAKKPAEEAVETASNEE